MIEPEERSAIPVASPSRLFVLFVVLSLSLTHAVAFQISDRYDLDSSRSSFSVVNQSSSFNNLSKGLLSKNVLGNQRTLVILVEFSDVKHSCSESDVNQLVLVNMRQYWEEVSYDKISVVGKTLGWRSLGNAMAHYGADGKQEIDDPNGDGETDSWRTLNSRYH